MYATVHDGTRFCICTATRVTFVRFSVLCRLCRSEGSRSSAIENNGVNLRVQRTQRTAKKFIRLRLNRRNRMYSGA